MKEGIITKIYMYLNFKSFFEIFLEFPEHLQTNI